MLRLDTQAGSHILDIDIQDKLIPDVRHRLRQYSYCICYALRGVSPVMLREDSGIEAQAVLLMLTDVLLDLLCCVGLGKGVRILPLR